jgi:hypothetical protein
MTIITIKQNYVIFQNDRILHVEVQDEYGFPFKTLLKGYIKIMLLKYFNKDYWMERIKKSLNKGARNDKNV